MNYTIISSILLLDFYLTPLSCSYSLQVVLDNIAIDKERERLSYENAQVSFCLDWRSMSQLHLNSIQLIFSDIPFSFH